MKEIMNEMLQDRNNIRAMHPTGNIRLRREIDPEVIPAEYREQLPKHLILKLELDYDESVGWTLMYHDKTVGVKDE